MDPEILIVAEDGISIQELIELSTRGFGEMVKAVVDVRREVMALGGELHADEEQVLLDRGSAQVDLWGINIYHGLPPAERVEFDSLINIRPSRAIARAVWKTQPSALGFSRSSTGWSTTDAGARGSGGGQVANVEPRRAAGERRQ